MQNLFKQLQLFLDSQQLHQRLRIRLNLQWLLILLHLKCRHLMPQLLFKRTLPHANNPKSQVDQYQLPLLQTSLVEELAHHPQMPVPTSCRTQKTI
jgi:hypothetical protein